MKLVTRPSATARDLAEIHRALAHAHAALLDAALPSLSSEALGTLNAMRSDLADAILSLEPAFVARIGPSAPLSCVSDPTRWARFLSSRKGTP